MMAIELVLVTSARCRAVARVVISSLFRFPQAVVGTKGCGRAGILGVRRHAPNGGCGVSGKCGQRNSSWTRGSKNYLLRVKKEELPVAATAWSSVPWEGLSALIIMPLPT